jgi:predicted NUDIX family NTP pyrophosphohydrolase
VTVLSVGLLLYRPSPDGVGEAHTDVEVLLAHMGGPFWSRKDDHAWTIPKGLCEPDDDPAAPGGLLAVAEREFLEEMGSSAPPGPTHDLGSSRAGGKRNHVYARAADFDEDAIVSNTFDLEWPPRSGRTQSFPEVDRAAWFGPAEARLRIVKSLVVFLDRLDDELGR